MTTDFSGVSLYSGEPLPFVFFVQSRLDSLHSLKLSSYVNSVPCLRSRGLILLVGFWSVLVMFNRSRLDNFCSRHFFLGFCFFLALTSRNISCNENFLTES